MHIKLRHEKADAAFVTGRVPLVAHEEVRFLFRCGQKLLSWAQKERPGDVPLSIAIAGQLKIQYGRDMMVLPKQIGIVKITVAENRVSRRERLCKKRISLQKVQVFAVHPALDDDKTSDPPAQAPRGADGAEEPALRHISPDRKERQATRFRPAGRKGAVPAVPP